MTLEHNAAGTGRGMAACEGKLKLEPLRAAVACVSLLCCQAESLAAPLLYSAPAHESPVRGEPDDLLLIAGYGFTRTDVVAYQALVDTTRLPDPPAVLPTRSSATQGLAQVVSKASVPHSLTVRLPPELNGDQSYVLWVYGGGKWSAGIKINDARPLWVTPAFVHASHTLDAIPRYLKVVGRNLQPAPGVPTRIRLVGPQTLVLDGDADDAVLARYATKAALPSRLQPGEYRVQLSRDGVSWVALDDQVFTVQADPLPPRQFDVASFGCVPDDGQDDVRCIAAALRAAAAAGGGQVGFGAGVWDMIDAGAKEVTLDGLIVPVGVSLAGADTGTSRIVRHARWGAAGAGRKQKAPPSFSLQGRNTVQRLTFVDRRVYAPQDIDEVGGILQLGKAFYRASPDVREVADVVITRNVFDRPMIAVGAGGLPIRRLIVTRNEFGAYRRALSLGGNRYNVRQRFLLEDSIIADNVFKPGSYLDAARQQGTTASDIGGALRLDFSANTADGAATQYLQDPRNDARGWRAAFFWHMNESHRMMLVARNTATCTGDKAGDGEAIAYDNESNTFALSAAGQVLNATADTVDIAGPLQDKQQGQDVNLRDYYVGHWVRVVDGPGLGQVRRIDSYSTQSGGARISMNVAPRWDVAPTRSSRIVIAREYWQVYTVANHIDHRLPLCRKSNANGPEGGKITLYAEFADSVVEGNHQYDTDGITLQHSYNATDPACPACKPGATFQSFVEVRDNLIEGEYDWTSDCSQSGILVSHSAAPTPRSPSPVVGYGLSVSHNVITRADGLRGGAITLPITWLRGPPPHDWRLLDSTLIHHNVITGLKGGVPAARCDTRQPLRIGINLYQDSLAWDTVVYANDCPDTDAPLVSRGRDTVVVCPSPARHSCECRNKPR